MKKTLIAAMLLVTVAASAFANIDASDATAKCIAAQTGGPVLTQCVSVAMTPKVNTTTLAGVNAASTK